MEQRYDYEKEAMLEMEKSPCEKRKVGAIIADEFGEIIGRGHNFNLEAGPCEDSEGATMGQVIHAEIAALDDAAAIEHKHLLRMSKPKTIYITHKPCAACMRAIHEVGIKPENVIIVEAGIKHDEAKLKYSLIPPALTRGVAEVMSFGAKKYKRSNWQKMEDPSRYLDALMRHVEAFRDGEEFDEETGLPHMAHVATNAGFLLWFAEEKGWEYAAN